MTVVKLVVRKRAESLNKLLNMHRMTRHSYNKRWQAAIRSASLLFLTGHDFLIETISSAREKESLTASAIADI